MRNLNKMGILDFRKREKIEKAVNEYFKMINGYTPSFTSFEGGLYEMELTRAAIHSFATHVSKLVPVIEGAGNTALERTLQFQPNPLMDTSKYLYRLSTVYMVDNNALIAPLYDEFGKIIGFYPLSLEKCQMVKGDNGKVYVRYELGTGQYGAIELEKAGRLTQFQNKNELWGESNQAMMPTLELMHANNEGIIEGVKNSATIRFMAKLAQTLKAKDIEEERKRLVKDNLTASNNGGVLMFDQKYEDIKQITSTPYTINAAQMNQIKENVFDYFGTNEAILQNKFTSAEWGAYYEGKIEPFAIQMSLVHTNMTFNDREKAFGNKILFTADKLQYASTAEKVQLVTMLFDRGFISHNDGLNILNLKPIEDGDKRYIRKEYAVADGYSEQIEDPNENEEENPNGEEINGQNEE